MYRGCIAVKEVACDACGTQIEYGERYLIVEKSDKIEHLCPACALNRGYAHYRTERGKRTLSFFESRHE